MPSFQIPDYLSFKNEREHLMGKSQVCKRNDSGHFSVHLQHRMTRSGPLVHQMVQFWHFGSQNVGSQNALSIFQTNSWTQCQQFCHNRCENCNSYSMAPSQSRLFGMSKQRGRCKTDGQSSFLSMTCNDENICPRVMFLKV